MYAHVCVCTTSSDASASLLGPEVWMSSQGLQKVCPKEPPPTRAPGVSVKPLQKVVWVLFFKKAFFFLSGTWWFVAVK